ncbi:hypothetical protein P2P98_14030 [Microbacterium sp. Kw_RZR3]|uniref:hypothetical protein n=1 Tax=Microbacterium sp. Kw_RZR3 TaxID=3032903 RepID=UPI0023DC596B|nr:hypothetical protein [Microbacterium sp. Kw_RZR3]MDF2047281.1 hypothetical protein [Microbacterium sp. Kw_RZR3]
MSTTETTKKGWRFWIVNTVTGERRREVFPKAGRWQTMLNGVGDGEHSFRLDDTDTQLPRDMWRSLSLPWASTLVVCWGDLPVYAGVILRRTWTSSSSTLVLSHKEFRVVATKRMLYGVGPYDARATLTIANKSNRGLARAFAFHALIDGGDRWRLPVALPPDETGEWTREIERWQFRTLESLLSEVQESDGGPDIHFRPRWTGAGTLEWELRLGTPRLTGPTLNVNVSATESPATNFTEIGDATMQLTGLWGLGEGSGAGRLVSAQPMPEGSPVPFLDTSRTFSNIDQQDRLDSITTESLQTSREMTDQWGFGLKGGDWPEKAIPGATVHWFHQGDRFVQPTPEGGATSYLIGVSGDMTDSPTGLDFQ